MCIGRSETSGIPSSSRERRIAPSGFRRRMKPRVYFSRRGYVVRVPGRQGAPRIGRPAGSRSSTMSAMAMTPSSGRPSSRGRTARWECRGARTSDRTSGVRPRPRRRAWSPSSRCVASTSIYHDWITLNGGMAAVVQLRLGPGAPGIAHHAEPGRAHRRRSARDPLRRGAAAPAAEHDAAAGRAPREVLRRLAGEPGLQRLLEAAQRGGDVRRRSRCPCIPSAAGSTSSARARCAATSG